MAGCPSHWTTKMIDTVAAKILEAAASGATSILMEALKRENVRQLKRGEGQLAAKFAAANQVVQSALKEHIGEIKTWANTIRFTDSRVQKSVLSIYVELD